MLIHRSYMVRIAQGLLHMGQGLVTLNPFHSDHELLRKVIQSANKTHN